MSTNLVTAYLQLMSVEELVQADADVLKLYARVFQDIRQHFQYLSPDAYLQHQKDFLAATSSIVYTGEHDAPNKVADDYSAQVLREVYNSVNQAKLLRRELSGHMISPLSLSDVVQNYQALSDTECEFDVEAKRLTLTQIFAFNQLQVSNVQHNVLSANAKNIPEILAAENFLIDPSSTEPIQQALNAIREQMDYRKHFLVFGKLKTEEGPFICRNNPQAMRLFAYSRRGALTYSQLCSIAQALPQNLCDKYLNFQHGRYTLKVPEITFLTELIEAEIDVSLPLERWQNTKLMGQLTLEQISKYGEMVYNTQLKCNTSASRAKVEMYHKFGFDASAALRVISTLLTFFLDNVTAFAQAKLVFNLVGVRAEILKSRNKRQKNRAKYVARCRKSNAQHVELAQNNERIMAYEATLQTNNAQFLAQMKAILQRANCNHFTQHLSADQPVTSQIQSIFDILLARQAEVELLGSAHNANPDQVILQYFVRHLQKHCAGYGAMANSVYSNLVTLGGIAGFFAGAYKKVSPQVATTWNVVEFVFKALVMTAAISAMVTLVVADTVPIITITAISAGIAALLSVNKIFQARIEANTTRIMTSEKRHLQSLRAQTTKSDRHKYALKFFLKPGHADARQQYFPAAPLVLA